MKKRIIMSMMIVVLLLATLIPSSGFAASTTPDWPTLPTGYYGWVKTTSSNGSTAFDELTEAAIKAAITGGIKTWAGVRGVQLRKHSKAREKRYSFGYAVSFIFACYQILWTFPKSRYLCSRYLPLACG